MDFVHRHVSFRRQPLNIGFHVNDDEHWVGIVFAKEFIDGDVVLAQFWSRMIPTNNAFTS